MARARSMSDTNAVTPHSLDVPRDAASRRSTLSPGALLPLVAPLCFVLATWSDAQIEFAWLPRSLIVVGIAMIALTAVCRLAAGNEKAGTAAAVAIGIGLLVDDVRIAACFIAFAVLLLILGRAGKLDRSVVVRRLVGVYRAIAVALFAVIAAGSVMNGSLPAAIASLYLDITHRGPAAPPDDAGPDIWLVLLDGYPGDDAAAHLSPDWNREAFPAALEGLGFDVQRGSRTNHLLTRLVLPSMFNGQHLDKLLPDDQGGDLAQQTRLLRSVLEESATLRMLGVAGYERVAISSGWAEVGPRRVDRLVELPQLTEFEVVLLRSSALGSIVGAIAPDLYSQQIRERIRATLASAADLARESHQAPRFVFVHVTAPHPPVVFGADGSPVNGSSGASVATFDQSPLPREVRISRQLGATDYISLQAAALARAIQASSARPPVIVLLSDHGTDIDWDPNDPLAGGMNERTSTILAVYSPGHPGLMPPGTTPVNVLVRLINAYGIARHPTQPDTTWSYRSPSDILSLVEVDPQTGEQR